MDSNEVYWSGNTQYDLNGYPTGVKRSRIETFEAQITSLEDQLLRFRQAVEFLRSNPGAEQMIDLVNQTDYTTTKHPVTGPYYTGAIAGSASIANSSY